MGGIFLIKILKKTKYHRHLRLILFTVEKTEMEHKKCDKHSKCKGFKTPDYGYGSDYDCGYNTIINCDECKYGDGRKNPEVKCNQPK